MTRLFEMIDAEAHLDRETLHLIVEVMRDLDVSIALPEVYLCCRKTQRVLGHDQDREGD